MNAPHFLKALNLMASENSFVVSFYNYPSLAWVKILMVSPLLQERTCISFKVCSLLNNRSHSMVIKKNPQTYLGIILNIQESWNDITRVFFNTCSSPPQPQVSSVLGNMSKLKHQHWYITIKSIPDVLNFTNFSSNVLSLI